MIIRRKKYVQINNTMLNNTYWILPYLKEYAFLSVIDDKVYCPIDVFYWTSVATFNDDLDYAIQHKINTLLNSEQHTGLTFKQFFTLRLKIINAEFNQLISDNPKYKSKSYMVVKIIDQLNNLDVDYLHSIDVVYTLIELDKSIEELKIKIEESKKFDIQLSFDVIQSLIKKI